MSKFGHPGESYSAYSDPPPLLPPPQPGYLLGLYKPLCESTIKRRRLFSFKVGGWGGVGGHGSLDDGCHGFLSKAFGIMAHPLLMSVLEEEGGGRKELREMEGETRARGGEGRQPVAHDHRITSSYSTSPVPVHGWSRVKGGSSRSWAHISCFIFCFFHIFLHVHLSQRLEQTNSCRGTDSGAQWVFSSCFFFLQHLRLAVQ